MTSQNKNKKEQPAKSHKVLRGITAVILILLIAGVFMVTRRPAHEISLNKSDEKVTADSLVTIQFNWPISRQLDFEIEPYIAGNWSFEDEFFNEHLIRKLVFIPEVTWAAGTVYTFTINGVRNVLSPWNKSETIRFSFTTQKLPSIVSITPEANGEIQPDNIWTVYFDVPNESLAEFNYSFEPSFDFEVIGNEEKNQYTIKPKSLLKQGTIYKLTALRKEVRYFWQTDEIAYQGEPEKIFKSSWQTREAPGIEDFFPTGDGVKATENISLTFTESVQKELLNENIIIEPTLTGVWQQNSSNKFTFIPSESLAYETDYTVTIKAGFKTETGGYFEDEAVYQFSTIGKVKVLSFFPADKSGGVGATNAILVTFDQAVVKDSAQLRFTMDPQVEGDFSWEGNTMTFQPKDKLSFNTTYMVAVLEGVRSVDGLDSEGNFSVTFTTEQSLVKLGVPFHRQERNLSCEVAALKMAMNYKGVNVSEAELVGKLPFDPAKHEGNVWGNPNIAFVGDIDGKQPTTGYGVYWQPIADIANQYGLVGTAFTGWTIEQLTEQIKNGHPVVVWGTASSGQRIDWQTPSGDNVVAVSGEHARTAIGYVGDYKNPTRIIVLDPLYGERYYSTSSFLNNWGVLGNSGVVVQ